MDSAIRGDAAGRALLPRLRRLDPDSLRTLTAGVEALRLVLEADAPTDLTEDDA